MTIIKRYTIDRFEGGYAVLENESGTVLAEASLLPGAREGDIVVKTADGGYEVDSQGTREARQAVKSRMRRLRKDG